MTDPMPFDESRRKQVFPILTAAQRQAALRFASGPARRYAPGETLFAVGDVAVPAFLLLAGTVVASQRDGLGHATEIATHDVGEITGEISQLAGRPALAEGRAGVDGCEAVPFDAAHLRALVVGSADIGEIVMRAFILRRTALITGGGAGSVLVGAAGSAAVVRLQGFLTRNGYPNSVIDPANDPDAAAIVEKFGIAPEELPIAVCPNGSVMRHPTEAEIGACLGITPNLDDAILYDVAIVGAGPAGLATAVYAASEGLSAIVVDSRAFGGQAGASARIENYFGFPTGISGQALTARAFTQAQKFGAEIAIPLEVARLECGGDTREPGDELKMVVDAEHVVRSRAVVIASGVRYRRPVISNLADFENAGVSYWASPIEAKLCAGEVVALVGGGNSAGQAIAYLAPKVEKLHLFIRGDGLAASMSRYLIDRIEALPNVELHTKSEVVGLEGEPGISLSGITVRDHAAKTETKMPIRHLFLFIGADPNTEWLESCTAVVDGKGFVVTGATPSGPVWDKFGRAPMPLETSVPGVFAIGDVRAGSTKRVAAAVGEGAAVVAQLHTLLAATA